MNSTSEILRGELERLFELEQMMTLGRDLLGIDPDELGVKSGKGAFARALVERCAEEDALEALGDAISLTVRDEAVRAAVRTALRTTVTELPAGTMVDEFSITKKIGEGDLGVVYLAERKGGTNGEAMPRTVALKVIRAPYARDKSAVRRFLTTLRAMKTAQVPGMARLAKVGQLPDGRPFVATVFEEGQTLAARLARVGPTHFHEARPVLRAILSALDELHQRGMVHGAIKTENVVVVRPEGASGRAQTNALLIDAGSDRLLARDGALNGSAPLFRSTKGVDPDLARGRGATPQTDLYAVGALLYETLTGRPPFTGESQMDVLAKHLTSSPDAPSTHAPRGWISKELDEIVLRMLSKDSGARFKNAAELRDALEAYGRTQRGKGSEDTLDQKAFAAAVAALKDEPDDEELAVAVERVAEPAGAWKKAIDAFNAVADETVDDEAKKSLLFRVARIQEAELEDPDGAEAAYRKILEIDPDDDIARIGVEELKRVSGDAGALIELLLEKAEREEEATERATILREIAQLYEEKLSSREEAFVAWVQALAEDPTDARTVREIERLADSPARWNEAVSSLSEAVQTPDDPVVKVQLYTLMGRWYGERLSRPDFALQCYGQALALDPSSEAAYQGTIELYRKSQSWNELVTVLLSRADASTSAPRARDYVTEAAEAVWKQLSDMKRASSLLERVLADDPGHVRASDLLAAIHLDQNAFKEAVQVLDLRAKSERGEGRVVTLLRVAELREDRLADLEGAYTAYEAAIIADPQNLTALKGIERVCARLGRFKELLANLEAQLSRVATPRQKISLLERMGGILEEEFVDNERAATEFERIVEIEPGHEAANTALERLYRKLGQFDRLADTLDRHAKACEDEPRKVDLLLRATRVLMSDVGAPARAAAMCEQVLAIAPKHAEALEYVAQLRSQAGDTAAAVDAVDQLARTEKDPKKKSDLLAKAARLLEEKGDADRAIERYRGALDAFAGNLTAAAGLRAIYTSRGDVQGAADLVVREIEATEGAMAKAKLYAEKGNLHREKLEEPAKARESYLKALELDPTCTPAARGLGQLSFDEGNFIDAVRHLEPLLSRTGDMTPADARDTCLRCGDALVKLQQFDKAQRAYLNAKAMTPNDREVLERVAEVTFETGAPDEAAELYRDIKDRFGKDLTPRDRGRVLYRRGEALRRADHMDDAATELEEAVALLPDDAGAFASLRKVYEAQGAWKKLGAALRSRIERAPEGERFDLLVAEGDVRLQKLDDRAGASKSFVLALELRPDDRNLLTKLMAVYSEAKDWSKLVEVVLRIAELVDDRKQLGKYYVTAAAISHRELNRLDEACAYYSQALTADPSLETAFEGLVNALGQKNDARGQAAAYRAHIERVAETAPPERRAGLYDALGTIYEETLKSVDEALPVYEEAQNLDPGNRARAEKLADLYAAHPKNHFKKAILAHEQLLHMSPYRVESYQALRKLYTDMKMPDEAFCLCQTLTSLNMAEPDEESFYKKHRAKTPAAAQEFLTDELWAQHLAHPHQDPMLTSILTLIAPAVRASRAQPLSTFLVQPKDKKDPETDAAPMLRMLHYAAGVSQITLPEVYTRDADAGGLSFLFTEPPAIGVGRAALAGGPSRALAFIAGRHLSFYRGGAYLRHLVPTGSGLRGWLLAAIKSATPQFPIAKDLTAAVDEHLAAFKKYLPAPDQEKLRSLVQKLLAAAPELDLKRWVAAMDLTADRLGFVLSNDLEIATAIIKASPEDAAAVSQKDRLRELYLYSASQTYFGLRRKLGISIGS